MWWIALWVVVTTVGVAGTVASMNGVRFGRRVAEEMRQMTAAAGSPPPATTARLSALPAPVRRYLAKALGDSPRPIRVARLVHGGFFRPSLDGSWLPIRGKQAFATSPPGFIWWGRVRMAPGLWIDARDRTVNGVGQMLIQLESTITLGDARGPELDQGALMRLLAEMAWFPTAFLDERHVRWSPIDDQHARATLEVNGRTVSGEFGFGDDDLLATFSADRYRDLGGGKSALTPFVGRSLDYRPVDRLLVPHRVVGAWVVDGREVEYVNFHVERLEFEFGG